ncbi:MAG: hypothetical protein QOE92_559, partial [Chloroflexota bacterium]|nr:hypothetical protein [Chloroflexota bacterium]
MPASATIGRVISAAATRRAALVVGYIAAWVVAAFVPIPLNDIDAFFLPSAQQVLAGHPLLAYQPLGQMDYPNANGPLALFPLAAAAALTQALGWMATLPLRRAVILALFSVAVLLMAREGVRAIDRHRDEPLAGGRRLLAYGALAAGPPVWQAVVGYGHVEQPLEAWLVLLAARWVVAERPARAGVSLGLGVLARSTAALFALPLALAAWRRGAAAAGGRKDVPGAAPLPGVARAAAVAGASVATAAAGLLPFF